MVTQEAIAAAAKVHKSTVSLALRNDPRLPAETRRRIQALARRMGYSPNPLVSLLMSRVSRPNVGLRGIIAYLHTVPAGSSALLETIHRNFIAGARLRADELGFQLDEFFLDGAGMSGGRMAKLLLARNVAGLVVEHTPGSECPGRTLPFDAAPFAAASLGVPLAAPPLHYVANDQFMRPVLAAREALKLGYRRPGLVIPDGRFDSAMAHRCSAGFWAVQHYAAPVEPIPILGIGGPRGQQALARWLRRHRPDVVFGTHESVPGRIRAAGLRVPEDCGWIHLDWVPAFAPAAGIHGNSERTGAAAVELVVSQIHRGETGPPARAMSHFVSGSWIPGSTVRRVGPPLDLESSFFADLTAV